MSYLIFVLVNVLIDAPRQWWLDSKVYLKHQDRNGIVQLRKRLLREDFLEDCSEALSDRTVPRNRKCQEYSKKCKGTSQKLWVPRDIQEAVSARRKTKRRGCQEASKKPRVPGEKLKGVSAKIRPRNRECQETNQKVWVPRDIQEAVRARRQTKSAKRFYNCCFVVSTWKLTSNLECQETSQKPWVSRDFPK